MTPPTRQQPAGQPMQPGPSKPGSSRPELVAPVPRWRQIAHWLRQEILSGRYPAGQPLPSEEVLAGEFGVSRPTVRQGIAALAGEGLVTVRRPYGTTVRDPHAPPATVEHRKLHLAGGAYTEPDSGYTDVGAPVHVRVDATVSLAALLGVDPGQPLATREVLQQEPSGIRRAVRLYVPFRVAAGVHMSWAKDGRLPAPVQVYTDLAAHGRKLTFTEHVRARMPVGDEAEALRIPPGTPLLIINRVSHDGTRPVALEEIRARADQTEPAYPLPVSRSKRQPTPTGR